ncbi:MAG: glycosyltransferase family 4 protein [Bacteroidales bacterium]|nr:glycosyltransferase family 4 protein [Bacteroidales bacterium]
MNILMLNHNMSGTGTFLRCYGFGCELAKLGHDVTILTTSKSRRIRKDIIRQDKLKIVEFPDLFIGKLRNGFCPYNTLNRISFLRNFKCDIVHAFDSRPVVIFPALYISRLKKVPLVMDWADWWGRGGTIAERSGKLFQYTFGAIETLFEEKFRHFASSATVISKALFQRLVNLTFDPQRILLVHQGCDVDRIKPLDKVACRKELFLDENQNIIGYLGVLLPGDAPLLFETCNIIAEKINNFKLLLIGNTRMPLNCQLKQYDWLYSTGFIPDDVMNKYISACDVMILPLKNNIASNGRWPSKVNDYLSAGKPVVSTPVSDLKEIFSTHEIGLLANDNPEEFSEAIIKVLRNKSLQKKLGGNARRYAERYLEWGILAKELERFYLKTIRTWR